MRAMTVNIVFASLCALAISACCKDDCCNDTTTTTTALYEPRPTIGAFTATPLNGSIPFRVSAACEAEAASGGSLTYAYSCICRRDGEIVESKTIYTGNSADISFVLDAEGDWQVFVNVCESGGGCANAAADIGALSDDWAGCYFAPTGDINEKVYAVINYTWSEIGLKDATSATIDYAGSIETKIIEPPRFSIGIPEGFVIVYAKDASVQDWFILKTDGDITVEAYEGLPPEEIDSYYYKVIQW